MTTIGERKRLSKFTVKCEMVVRFSARTTYYYSGISYSEYYARYYVYRRAPRSSTDRKDLTKKGAFSTMNDENMWSTRYPEHTMDIHVLGTRVCSKYSYRWTISHRVRINNCLYQASFRPGACFVNYDCNKYEAVPSSRISPCSCSY